MSGIGQEQGFSPTSSTPTFGTVVPTAVGLVVGADSYQITGEATHFTVTPTLESGNPGSPVLDGSSEYPNGFGVRRGSASTPVAANLSFYADARAGVTDETGVVSYQSYGYWNYDDLNPVNRVAAIGSFSVGSATTPSAIPTTGTATFSGHLLAGYLAGGSLTPVEVAAPVSVNVNFSGRTAAFTSPDWRSATTIYAGTALSGTLTYQAQQNALTGTLASANGLMSGPATGQFYGPAAQELGGVFTLSPANGGVDRAFGAFGAAR